MLGWISSNVLLLSCHTETALDEQEVFVANYQARSFDRLAFSNKSRLRPCGGASIGFMSIVAG
jgi:hypothetical protein